MIGLFVVLGQTHPDYRHFRINQECGLGGNSTRYWEWGKEGIPVLCFSQVNKKTVGSQKTKIIRACHFGLLRLLIFIRKLCLQTGSQSVFMIHQEGPRPSFIREL